MTKSIVFVAAVLTCSARAYAQGPATPGETSPSVRIAGNPAQSELLWQKLDATVQQVNRDLDGTMGVAILDLTDGRTLLLNPDAVFTQASSIKVAVLAELYRQQQQSDAGRDRQSEALRSVHGECRATLSPTAPSWAV